MPRGTEFSSSVWWHCERGRIEPPVAIGIRYLQDNDAHAKDATRPSLDRPSRFPYERPMLERPRIISSRRRAGRIAGLTVVLVIAGRTVAVAGGPPRARIIEQERKLGVLA